MEKKIDFNGEFSNEYDVKAKVIIPGYHTIYELVLYLLKDNLNNSARLLVAGVGTGKEIVYFSENNPEWSFVGFDPAEPMLAIAKQKILSSGLEKRITLVHGLINDVNTNEFDAATSILVMQFLSDDGTKQNYLNEISAKLKSGAKLIIVDLEGDKISDEYKLFISAWKAQQMSTRIDADSVIEEFEIRDEEVQLVPQHRIDSLLKEAGFTNIQKFYKAYLFAGYIATKI